MLSAGRVLMNCGSETQERCLHDAFGHVVQGGDSYSFWRISRLEDLTAFFASYQPDLEFVSKTIRASRILIDFLALDIMENDHKPGSADMSAFVESLLARAIGDFQLPSAQSQYFNGCYSHLEVLTF